MDYTTIHKKALIDNKGIALVSVMVIATVCLLISTIILELTYNSLLSRKVYNISSNTDATAEAVVDDMEAVVQSIASYTVSTIGKPNSKNFITTAKEVLLESADLSPLLELNTLDDAQKAKIADYLYGNMSEQYQKMFAKKDDSGNPIKVDGKYVRDGGIFSVTAAGTAKETSDGKSASLSIGIQFTYTDQSGYVSTINTDLVMNDVTRRLSATDYPLGSYSMFNGGGVEITTDKNGLNEMSQVVNFFKQYGNVYIGTMGSKAPTAMTISGGIVVDFEGAVIINGDVYIENNSVLRLEGGQDEKGNLVEVTILGNVYIDDTSALVLGDKMNFMAKDVIIMNKGRSNQRSVFDANKNSYMLFDYDEASRPSYNGFFPFKYNNFKNLMESNSDMAFEGDNQNNKGVGSDIEFDFSNYYGQYSHKVGGCILVQSGDKAYVADYTSDGWKLLGAGAPKLDKKNEAGTKMFLCNKNEYCTTKAKTACYSYFGEIIEADPEFASFANVAVMDYQAKLPTAQMLSYQSTRIIPHNESNEWEQVIDTKTNKKYIKIVELTKGQDFSINKGGSDCTGLTSVGTGTTSSLAIKDVTAADDSGMSLPKTITVNENDFNKILCKFGDVQAQGEVTKIEKDNTMTFICSNYSYKVQGSKGRYCGIMMSNDYTYYEVQGGTLLEGYSIINVKDQKDTEDEHGETEADKVTQLMAKLQYVCFQRDFNTNDYFKGYDDNSYRLMMMNNSFQDGMSAFVAEKGTNNSSGYEFAGSSMYDFITVENWQQY